MSRGKIGSRNKMIKLEAVHAYQKKILTTPRYKLARNALTRSKKKDVVVDWDRYTVINHNFSHKVPTELKITSQKQSGRCWLFAATNVLRLKMANRYKLDKFEFSQSYLFFWDKFEKANFFLESIIETAEEPVDSRLVMHLLSKPLEDGGQWHMFVSLVEKYGLVPQDVFKDSCACTLSNEVNQTVIEFLRECASILRLNHKKKPSELRKLKEDMMEKVYRMLAIHIGTPPTRFDWEFQDKNKKFHAYRNLTPKEFHEKFVKVNLDDYVCLVHTPRKSTPMNKTYTVEYLGNVVEGKQIKYINVPIEEMKKACVKTIKDKEPVWFGCDVGKYLHRELGVMDQELFDYSLVYDVEFNSTKEERMNYGSSMMTHAMVFTGVNLVNDQPDRWRVENSWGEDSGDKGYYIMTDDWFDEFMFEVAIEKKYLPKKILDLLDLEPIPLKPWDPMGALAL